MAMPSTHTFSHSSIKTEDLVPTLACGVLPQEWLPLNDFLKSSAPRGLYGDMIRIGVEAAEEALAGGPGVSSGMQVKRLPSGKDRKTGIDPAALRTLAVSLRHACSRVFSCAWCIALLYCHARRADR
jgi:hypothetical protein